VSECAAQNDVMIKVDPECSEMYQLFCNVVFRLRRSATFVKSRM